MSATQLATVLPFPSARAAPGLDYSRLLALSCRYGKVHYRAIEVLDDHDGAVTRFLCRGPRAEFDSAEDFVAAAVKRYLASIDDDQLAEMMFATMLFECFSGERIPTAFLTHRLDVAFEGGAPPWWLDELNGASLLDAIILNPRSQPLELVARDPRSWLFALVEG